MKQDFFTSSEYAPYIETSYDAWNPIISLLEPEVGEGILAQHLDEGKYVYLIVDGYVEMLFERADGFEYINFFGGPGYIFGFRSCISGNPYAGTLKTLTKTTYYKIPFGMVINELQFNEDFFRQVIISEYERGKKYTRKLELLSLSSIKRELRAIFISLANATGRNVNGVYTIPFRLTHEQLSKLIYSDRVSVSRIISLFKKSGYIEEHSGFYSIPPQSEWYPFITKGQSH